jgi:hypothetical protein
MRRSGKMKKILSCEWMSKKFMIRLLIVLVIITFILRLFNVSAISDALLLGLMAHSGTLIGLNVWDKKRNGEADE